MRVRHLVVVVERVVLPGAIGVTLGECYYCTRVMCGDKSWDWRCCRGYGDGEILCARPAGVRSEEFPPGAVFVIPRGGLGDQRGALWVGQLSKPVNVMFNTAGPRGW